MTTLIFDDTGRCWDAHSSELRRALRCPFPDFDFQKYLIDNLGFVAVTIGGRGGARVRLRPAIASPIGLAAAHFALADAEPERVVISHPGDGCGDELFAGLAGAFERIAELTSSANAAEPAFLKQKRPAMPLIEARGPLSVLLVRWVDWKPLCEPSGLEDILRGSLCGRFMLVEHKAEGLVIGDVGPGFVAYDEPWRCQARGLPVEHQPDYAYGLWVRGIMQSALERDRPSLDEIDAVIARPRQGDRVRVRYLRLILPFERGPSGAPCLLSASVVDPTIDLRQVGGGALAVGAR